MLASAVFVKSEYPIAPHDRFGSKAAVGEARFTTYQTVLNGCKPLVPREFLAWPAPTTGPLEPHRECGRQYQVVVLA